MLSDIRFKNTLLIACLLLSLLTAALVANELQVGYAVIQAQAGGPAPVASALFSYKNGAGVLVSEAAVGAVETMRSGRVFVDQDGTSTGIAFANPSSQPVQLELVLRDSLGAEIDRKTLELPARGHLPRFVSDPDLFPAAPPRLRGSLTFTALQPGRKVAAVTIRQGINSRGEALFATLPVANLDAGTAIPPGGPRSIVFPHIGAGGPLSTQIVLFNPGAVPMAGLIRLTDSNGKPLPLRLENQPGSEFPFHLGPHATFQGTLTTTAGVLAGYATVRVDEGQTLPVGTAVFQFRDAAGIVSEAGVGAIEPTRTARIFVDTVGTQTGVALASPGNGSITIQFKLYHRNGLELKTVTRTLPPNGHIGIFADQLFPEMPPAFTGILEVRSPSPIIPITLKLTTNSRKDLILTTLPVADLDDPPIASAVILPQIGFGLGFSTRLIFINSRTSEAASGTLSFTASDGSPMVLPLTGDANSEFEYEVVSGGARQMLPGNSLPVASILLNPSGSTTEEVVVNQGNTLILNPLVLDSGGNPRDDFPIGFSSLSQGIAGVDPLGRIQGISAGFSTITVTAGGVVSTGTITVVDVTSGTGGFGITGVVQDQSKRLYLANSSSHTILLAQDLTAVPAIYAGQSQTPGLVNDFRTQSRFDQPSFLAIDKGKSTLYVSDTANHVLRLVEPGSQGRVQTLAGTGTPGAKDGPRESSTFNTPRGVALDERGFLWVADSGNHTVRRLSLATGAVTTVAGKSGAPGFQDGSGGNARFRLPTGIAVIEEPLAERLQRESVGGPLPPVRVVVADTGNGQLREVREDGLVRTLTPSATSSSTSLRLRTGVWEAATLGAPTDVAVDPFGNIYVTDPAFGRVNVLLNDGRVVEAIQEGTILEPRGLTIDESGRVTISGGAQTGFELAYGPPEISGLNPGQVGVSGGQSIHVQGSNFAPDTRVVAAGVLIEDVDVSDTENLTLVAPRLPSGRTTLTLINRGGVAQAALLVAPPPIANLPPGYIATVAGGSTFAQDGASATLASLSFPRDVAVDPAGNLLICDTQNNRIRRVDARTGIMTTLAGNGLNGFEGDGGNAVAASFSYPSGLAIDRSGNVFVADSSNSRIRRIDSGGTVSTVAGNGFIVPLSPLGDGGPATEAAVALPGDVEVDSENNLYIADTLQHRVRLVDSKTGIITTVAGNGEGRFSGDGGPAEGASLNAPSGLALDEGGNLYIADTENHRIRRVNLSAGTIITVAGSGVAGFSGDGGQAIQAKLNSPERIAVDSNGNLFIADVSNFRVRRVDTNGVITTSAGGGSFSNLGDEGPAQSAFLALPSAVTLDSAGNLIIADTFNNRVRLVSSKTGWITTVAGSGTTLLGDGEAAVAAFLQAPSDVAIDSQGTLFIADQALTRIRRIDAATGLIHTAAGGGDPESSAESGLPATEVALVVPSGVAVDGGDNLYIADAIRVRRVDAHSGLITTVAGDGAPPDGIGDGGLPLQAAFTWARGVRVDGIGNVFIVDAATSRVRRVSALTGLIETVAGGGTPGDGLGDGLAATLASLSGPAAIALDAEGNLFVADTFNNRIRRVDVSTGVITTVAGNGDNLLTNPSGSIGDDGPATEAMVNLPTGVVVDAAGNIFLSDLLSRIRRVDATTGIITTVAGGGHPEDGVGDLLPATQAALRINLPSGLAVSGTGDLLISDTSGGRVRLVRGAAPAGPAVGAVRISALEDDAESNTGIWTTAGSQGSSTWTRSSEKSRTPARSWLARGLSSISDQRLTTTTSISLPADADLVLLTFWHSFNLEAEFDGGVVEVSVNEGQSWLDTGPAILLNGYTGTIVGADNALFGRSAFTGLNPRYPGFDFTAIDLTELAGERILIRFRAGTDSGVGAYGWNVDDIILSIFWE